MGENLLARCAVCLGMPARPNEDGEYRCGRHWVKLWEEGEFLTCSREGCREPATHWWYGRRGGDQPYCDEHYPQLLDRAQETEGMWTCPTCGAPITLKTVYQQPEKSGLTLAKTVTMGRFPN